MTVNIDGEKEVNNEDRESDSDHGNNRGQYEEETGSGSDRDGWWNFGIDFDGVDEQHEGGGMFYPDYLHDDYCHSNYIEEE